MRRITAAARSLAGRAPSMLRFALGAVPDVLLVGGFLVIAAALRDVIVFSVNLGQLWLGLVPFVAGAAVEIRSFRRAAK